MSVNYHAFQCRGYLLEDYEAHCEHWRGMFRNYQPERAARILGLETDETYIYLTYYGADYRLRLKDGVLEKNMDGVWSGKVYFNEAMSCYHRLYYVKDAPQLSGRWVPNVSLDEAASRTEGQDEAMYRPFEQRFSGRLGRLRQICERLGGKPIPKGDLCFEFEPFPGIGLQVMFYDQDEEFPAKVTALVDSHITDFLHFETTGCLVSDLFEMIEKLDRELPGSGS